MTNGRALEAALDAMHGLVADALITELKQHNDQLELNPIREIAAQANLAAWEEAPEETRGKPPAPFVPYQIPPQFLDKVLKFLAQNGINAPRSSPKVDRLARELADLDLDAEARAH